MTLKLSSLEHDFEIKHEPKLYTTGAFLVPMKIERAGRERYVWVVADFNDDTFHDGELCSDLTEAATIDELIKPDEEDL